MGIRHFYIIGTLILSLLSQNAIGQVVNIEKKRKDDKDGFVGTVSLGFFLIDNGKRIFQFKNLIDLQYKNGPNTIILLNDLNMMRVDSDILVNGGFQHLRYNYTVHDSGFFTIEAFLQHQYNPIKLLNRRLLGGFGPRLRIFKSQKSQFYIGILSMYEYEQLSDSLLTNNRIGRLDSYLNLNWNILKNMSLNYICYYQPAFRDISNFRLSMENTLELKITNSLSFKIGLQANYDSKPPENIEKLFYFWENALTYNF